MRFVVTLRDGRPAGTETEALIDAAAEARLSTLMPYLLQALDDDTDPDLSAGVAVWVDGAPVISAGQTLRSAGIRPGSVIELHAGQEPPAAPPSGVAEIRVVNGPGAGRVHRLGVGHTVLGHEAPGLSLPDEGLAADALTVIARPGGQVEVEPSAGTSARLDGVELTGRSPWSPGGYLVAGATVLELDPVSGADGRARPEEQGLGVELTRSARSTPERTAGRFVLPARPAPAGSPRSAEYRQELQRWQQDRAMVRAEVLSALARETEERRAATPDPAAGLLIALGPGRRLWERRALDDDWLQLRLGLAAQPPRTVIEDLDGGAPVRLGPTRWHAQAPEPLPALLPDVPVTLNLQAVGLLGIAGHEPTAQAVCRWLAAQCAIFHAPRELRIAVLTANDYPARRRWEWVARLPHARPDEVSGVSVLIGNDEDSVVRRLEELTELITARTQPRRPGTLPVPSSPEVVVVLDGVQRLIRSDGVGALLEGGQAAGVHLICVEAAAADLPQRCRAVIDCGPGRLTLRRADSLALEGIRPDEVEPAWADRLSRALAPVRLAPGKQLADDPRAAGDPLAWAVAWDDVGYPAPLR